MTISAGINGFGRFGLHLLKYWIDRNQEADFRICYINDDTLSLKDAYDIIVHDEAVTFNKYKVKTTEKRLVLLEPNGAVHEIEYTNTPKEEIPWLGVPHLVFECSGKSTAREDCNVYLHGDTRLVIISATSWDAEKMLIYGFNHEEYDGSQRIISYGSCTVNAYVPLANYIHSRYGVINSDVNVIHNIQRYRLNDNYTLIRKVCTLEKVAQRCLGFVKEDNFLVNYTVIPYTGVSMLDIRFQLEKNGDLSEIVDDLGDAFSHGDLKNMYCFDEVDIGPEVYNCTTYSSVFIRNKVRLLGNNLYLYGYFDNENSVNRFFDLVQYICTRIMSSNIDLREIKACKGTRYARK